MEFFSSFQDSLQLISSQKLNLRLIKASAMNGTLLYVISVQ